MREFEASGKLERLKFGGQMAVERREHPRCRKQISKLLAERGCALENLLEELMSENMHKQVRKMIDEERQTASKMAPSG